MAPEPNPPTDEEIIARVLSGDGRAFEMLVERHKAQMAGIVVRKVPRQEAPEVVHQVFIKAFVSLPGYRPLKPFSHWLSTLAVRACHDFWRERYRSRETPLSGLAPEPDSRRELKAEAAQAASAPDAYEAFEAWQILDWALGHLSPDDRMALTLVHLEGYSLAEAAEALGWSQAVVKLRTFRARRKLRKIIAGSLSGEVGDGSDER
ncbi:MAG: RNA polymerase sigma factor [Pseudomonadota bacterium]